jgi:hypothetical protein
MNKNTFSHLIIAFVVAITLFIANSTMARVTPAGSVTSLTGDVHIERHGATVPATPGMAVDVGDRVVTAANSHVTMTGGGSVQVPAGHKTMVVCGFAPLQPSELAAAAGPVAAAGGVSGTTRLLIGGAIVVGGATAGGPAAGRAFGGGGGQPPPRTTKSPNQ